MKIQPVIGTGTEEVGFELNATRITMVQGCDSQQSATWNHHYDEYQQMHVIKNLSKVF